MSKHSSHILELAKRGAEHRYRELKAEIAFLWKHFPHLRGGAARRLGSRAETVKSRVRGRDRRKMSAAAKKAISQRMKQLWAARRKARKG
jgi:hypothetical protein